VKSPPAPLFPPSVLPLCKRGIKGDFRNLPQPLFFLLPFSPFVKGGLRGISEISPSPSFIKRGVVCRNFIQMGNSMR